MPMHIGQASLDSVVIEGELLVVQAQKVQGRGVKGVDRDRILRRLRSEIVRGSVAETLLEAASR